VLGAALRRFLREHHFSASRAVVGLPAKWIVAQQREVPPASAAAVADTLRLQAERSFAPEIKDVQVDFAGQSSLDSVQKLLLVAVPGQQLERITELADAAGLRLVAVTVSTLCLALAVSDEHKPRVVVNLGRDVAELAVCMRASPRSLKHVAISWAGASPMLGPLGSEIRRTVSLMADGDGVASVPHLLVSDRGGMQSGAADILQKEQGLSRPDRDDLAFLKVTAAGEMQGRAAGLAVPTALALAGGQARLLPVDFLHSKLSPKQKARFGRRTIWAGAVGIMVIGLFAALFVHVRGLGRQRDDLIRRLDSYRTQIKADQALIDQVAYAELWYDARPGVLECLRQLSETFPQEGVIWTSSLKLSDNSKASADSKSRMGSQPRSVAGQVDGKAVDRERMLAVLDRLKANKSFSKVNFGELRDAAGQSRDVAFTISFTFTPTEKQP
jgi:Tfp pilus assembly PilM family ATPase